MPIINSHVLGLHLGHDASCSLAVDGVIAAACQQERLTRIKHDGSDGLSNRLPIETVLKSGGASLERLDLIVSCFQSIAHGGTGFGRVPVERSFDLFDAMDPRHRVISHHLAHAWSAVGLSGFSDATVVVHDLGGSTTDSGEDFELPFREWAEIVGNSCSLRGVKTESLSIYRWEGGRLELLDREFVVPHSAPDVFVWSVASLYENAARLIFAGRPAYGELMALAAYGDPSELPFGPSDIMRVRGTQTEWLNGWQRHVDFDHRDFRRSAAFAAVVQQVTETALLTYCRHALRLSGVPQLALAGGAFLNILANTKIAQSGLFSSIYVPSAPHDAGISAGCALYGSHATGVRMFVRNTNDRLGPRHTAGTQTGDLSPYERLIEVKSYKAEEVAEDIAKGAIIARKVGRSEFGPRALGGRSILGTPVDLRVKKRMNEIKGRQPWRPVAPVVVAEKMQEFFPGRDFSPFMNFSCNVAAEHSQRLPALFHPDGSTRPQSLERHNDPQLYELLLLHGDLTNFPILVNTSLNGPSEPIRETVSECVEFFLIKSSIDGLISDGFVIQRSAPWSKILEDDHISLASEVALTAVYLDGKASFQLSRKHRRVGVSGEVAAVLLDMGRMARPSHHLLHDVDEMAANEMWNLMLAGFLVVS